MSAINTVGVLLVWTLSPLMRKYTLNLVPAEVFTFMHAISCAFAVSLFYISLAPPDLKVSVDPMVLLLIFLHGITSSAGSYLLSTVIAEHQNPGEVMAVLNALTTVCTYLLGLFVFGAPWSWEKTGGIFLIAAGLLFIR